MQLFEVCKPSTFKDYLACLNVLVEEANLELSHEGLKVVSMDPSYVAMVELILPPAYFDKFNVGEPDKVGVNVKTLIQAMGKVGKDDPLSVDHEYTVKTIETKDDLGNVVATRQTREDEKLILTLGWASDVQRKKIVPCLTPLDEEVPQPRIFFKSRTRMITQVLKRILDDLDGEHVTISTDSDGITFSHNGDAYSESTPLRKDSDHILDHKVEEPVKTTYTKDYLAQITKAAVKVSEVVDLQFSQDMPIRVEAELPEGRLVYHVAPCIGI